VSLLMDALKKAEQEKKEAARRQQEDREQADRKLEGQERPRTPDDTDTWDQEIDGGDQTGEIPAAEKTRDASTTAEMELEPITATDDTAEIPTDDAATVASVEPEDPTLNVTMNELSLAELAGDAVGGDDVEETLDRVPPTMGEVVGDRGETLDETFHGISLDRTDPELFRETVQGEPLDDISDSLGETLPGIPAAQLAEDIGTADQPTPAAAQTVFAATGTTQPAGRGSRWLLAGIAAAVVVVITVWSYFAITPENRPLPSPEIARGIENVGPPLRETLNLTVEPVRGAAPGEAGGAPAGESMSGTLKEAPVPAAESTEAVARAETGLPPPGAEAGPPVADETVEAPAPVGPAAAKTGTEADAEETRTAMLPERIEPEPSLIRISRSRSPEQESRIIRDAYIAYSKGAHGTAMEKYQQVLADYPDNTDALLGMGAIAASSGDYQSAYKFYARVLHINPQNRFARAALINLQDRTVMQNSESTITSMLQDNPDRHYLHFTLGNIYAAGSRWSKAQQAFFDAYRLNSSDPDYALNLAIALDHIGQYAAALDYYNAALQLSGSVPPGFDIPPVKKRISDLNRIVEN